jgi:hypothetical protein
VVGEWFTVASNWFLVYSLQNRGIEEGNTPLSNLSFRVNLQDESHKACFRNKGREDTKVNDLPPTLISFAPISSGLQDDNRDYKQTVSVWSKKSTALTMEVALPTPIFLVIS